MPSRTLIGGCRHIASLRRPGDTPFSYRRVSAQDADALAPVYFAAYPPGIAASGLDDARTEMIASFAGDYGKLLRNASLAACYNDQLIGAILVVERSPWDANLGCPFVIDFFIDPQWRGKGIGRELFSRSAQACLDEGETRLALRTGEGTSPVADRIYSAAGMVEIDPDDPLLPGPRIGGVTIARRQDPVVVDRILRSLPDWFGIEEAIESYVESASQLDSFLAVVAGEAVGVALVHRHFPESAELSLIAVQMKKRGCGVGSALVDSVADTLGEEGCQLLQVHTVGPSFENDAYAQTREFYRRAGFIPLQEFNRIDWDGPSLVLVKLLGS